jgi:hypothetical protein
MRKSWANAISDDEESVVRGVKLGVPAVQGGQGAAHGQRTNIEHVSLAQD